MQLFWWQQLPLLILVQFLDPFGLLHVLQAEAWLAFYSGGISSKFGGIIRRYPCVGHDACYNYRSPKYNPPSLHRPVLSQSQHNLLRSRKLKTVTEIDREYDNVPTLSPWQATKDDKKPNKHKLAATIGGAGAAFALVVIGLIVYFCLRRLKNVVQRTSDTTSSAPSPPGHFQTGWGRENSMSSACVVSSYETYSIRSLSLSELDHATRNFNQSNIIGEGSFGLVYKGLLNDGSIVAIKRRQQHPVPHFVNEVMRIASVHHRHLVKLIGYCDINRQQFLVYDYLPNGNVGHHLYDGEGIPVGKLEMRQRLLIALGAAKGLEHLHSLVPPTFHMHFKTRNVLVDENFVAKVSDFGLTKLLPTESHRTESSSSIDCFHDPVLRLSKEFTDKGDVYSFGVFLLELISGHEVLHENLVLQAKNAYSFESFVDKSVKDHTIHALKEMLKLALLCVDNHSTRRPTMKSIVEELEQIQEREFRHFHSGRIDDIGTVTLGSELFK